MKNVNPMNASFICQVLIFASFLVCVRQCTSIMYKTYKTRGITHPPPHHQRFRNFNYPASIRQQFPNATTFDASLTLSVLSH